jgi:hypothetical protein
MRPLFLITALFCMALLAACAPTGEASIDWDNLVLRLDEIVVAANQDGIDPIKLSDEEQAYLRWACFTSQIAAPATVRDDIWQLCQAAQEAAL